MIQFEVDALRVFHLDFFPPFKSKFVSALISLLHIINPNRSRNSSHNNHNESDYYGLNHAVISTLLPQMSGSIIIFSFQ